MNTSNNILKISRLGRLILIGAFICEMIFFPSFQNLEWCLVILYSWTLFEVFIFKMENFRKMFLPTVAMVGYIFMFTFLPLIITLLEGHPITFNFEVAEDLALYQTINMTVIVFAFMSCKICYTSHNIFTSLFKLIGLYKPPTDNQIWTISILGIVFFIITALNFKESEGYDAAQATAEGGVLSWISITIQGFMMIPLCMFFRSLYGSKQKGYNVFAFVSLFALIIISAIIMTRRSYIFYPIFSGILISVFAAILRKKCIISFRKFILLSIVFLVVSGPFAELAVAMAICRGEATGTESFKTVMNLYNDKERLHTLENLYITRNQAFGGDKMGWSEYYVDNVLLDRFCNLRVQDASLFYAKNLGFNNKYMHDYAKDFIIMRLPSPLVTIIGEHKIVNSSPQDRMLEQYFILPRGSEFGNMVGGDVGIGLNWLGNVYYIISFLIYFLVFYILSSCVYTEYNKIIIPVPILCTLAQYFMYFRNSIGIFSSINFIMRGWEQNIIIYCILMFIIRIFIR